MILKVLLYFVVATNVAISENGYSSLDGDDDAVTQIEDTKMSQYIGELEFKTSTCDYCGMTFFGAVSTKVNV